MSLRGVPMTAEERAAFLRRSSDEFAEALSDATGRDVESIRERTRADSRAVLDGPLEDHRFLRLVDAEGTEVGRLWLTFRGAEGERHAYVTEVEIVESLRGRGYGRAALELAEDLARAEGLTEIALHVFAANQAGRGLYESLGYAPIGIMMTKRLNMGKTSS